MEKSSSSPFDQSMGPLCRWNMCDAHVPSLAYYVLWVRFDTFIFHLIFPSISLYWVWYPPIGRIRIFSVKCVTTSGDKCFFLLHRQKMKRMKINRASPKRWMLRMWDIFLTENWLFVEDFHSLRLTSRWFYLPFSVLHTIPSVMCVWYFECRIMPFNVPFFCCNFWHFWCWCWYFCYVNYRIHMIQFSHTNSVFFFTSKPFSKSAKNHRPIFRLCLWQTRARIWSTPIRIRLMWTKTTRCIFFAKSQSQKNTRIVETSRTRSADERLRKAKKKKLNKIYLNKNGNPINFAFSSRYRFFLWNKIAQQK